jgi:hypothetical protein
LDRWLWGQSTHHRRGFGRESNGLSFWTNIGQIQARRENEIGTKSGRRGLSAQRIVCANFGSRRSLVQIQSPREKVLELIGSEFKSFKRSGKINIVALKVP